MCACKTTTHTNTALALSLYMIQNRRKTSIIAHARFVWTARTFKWWSFSAFVCKLLIHPGMWSFECVRMCSQWAHFIRVRAAVYYQIWSLTVRAAAVCISCQCLSIWLGGVDAVESCVVLCPRAYWSTRAKQHAQNRSGVCVCVCACAKISQKPVFNKK